MSNGTPRAYGRATVAGRRTQRQAIGASSTTPASPPTTFPPVLDPSAVSPQPDALSVAPELPTKAPIPAPDEKRVHAYLNLLRIQREAKRRLNAEENPPFVLPPLATLRDRLALPRPDTRWRIDGWLPTNARVMCSAQYKAGKTTLVTNLIRTLIDGDPWLGTAAVTPIDGYVVLIDAEMAQTQLDDWHRDQGIQNDDRVVPISLRGALTGFNLLDANVRAAWAAHFRILSAKYLVLDCLRPILDALGLDEMHDAGRFLVTFDAFLAEAGIREAAVVQHMGHGAERARGDSRLRDWPDVEWRLVRQKNEDPASTRFISAFGRDVEVAEQQLAYDKATRRLTLSNGGSRREATLQQALNAVLDALAGVTEPLSFRGLQDAVKSGSYIDYPRDLIRDAIKFGVRTEKIVTEAGPRKATLHRLPTPRDIATAPLEGSFLVGECAAVCDECPPPAVGECASASIEARTLHTHAMAETPDSPAAHSTGVADATIPKKED